MMRHPRNCVRPSCVLPLAFVCLCLGVLLCQPPCGLCRLPLLCALALPLVCAVASSLVHLVIWLALCHLVAHGVLDCLSFSLSGLCLCIAFDLHNYDISRVRTLALPALRA